jgi:hypothetical protein
MISCRFPSDGYASSPKALARGPSGGLDSAVSPGPASGPSGGIVSAMFPGPASGPSDRLYPPRLLVKRLAVLPPSRPTAYAPAPPVLREARRPPAWMRGNLSILTYNNYL